MRPASTENALQLEKLGSVAIGESTTHSAVLVAKSTPEPLPTHPDEALKAAIKAAVDAGDVERVKALVAVLESSPSPAPVLVVAGRPPRPPRS